ncbi:tRNA (N(6)-L-threonylcarbamoyladenosine(37)-C(2))-methylthiotransferase MtaB [Desulfovirgula thermocuniculi]|uniref:tRNA (N(6)-L-threonylcarbamoyladenosine(37)-C(2))- methylthiotransferase MtaB n=1 Tax=Desulfovirgula thermocuniculi TaxID=348842 RepID=UPI0004082ED6|nr:tRNA (N(6)-L-threonylcarbamoyladenosine(37)-C(2))-methylthiotransferase MtaB [Desulfovirgula thermocuniculi]
MPAKVALATLGCKVNQYESSALATMFKERGYQVVDFDEVADIYIINTCTVTHLGDKKSRQLIRRAARRNPRALIVVTGCYAQVSPQEVSSIPGVDLVVGTADKHRLVELVEACLREKRKEPLVAVSDFSGEPAFQELPVPALPSRVRAFLKIQEGCNNYCAYCIIPYARGPLRSRDAEKVLAEAQKLVAEGYREIVLTGIHTGAYGQDRPGGPDLAELVERVSRIPGLLRLRLSSVEPLDVSEKLLAVMSSRPNVCRHLHIPLQSGDDEILARMRRRYDTAWFRRLVARVRETLPGVAITTDVMVGFPGETEEHFRHTYNFVREMRFSRLHVFKFSPRPGTPAAAFPAQVGAAVKEERSRRMIALGEELARAFAAGHLGMALTVLVEEKVAKGSNGDLYTGLTDNYLRVTFPADGEDLVGHLVVVKIKEVAGAELKGIMEEDLG